MKKRLFICCTDSFPFGSANSNYIRNFAKCALKAGFRVIVIGIGKNNKEDYKDGRYFYQNIEYENIDIKKVGPKDFLNVMFRADRYMQPILNKHKICKNDLIYVYSDFYSVSKMALKNVPVENITRCEVEWFQPFQYKKGILEPMYWIWRFGFDYRRRKIPKVFPISRKLEEYYKGKGNQTCLLPPMSDSSEVNIESISVRNHGVTNLIYSGAATNKDSFLCMIEALTKLSESDKEKVRLHFTSLNEGALRVCLGNNQHYVDRLKSVLVFHGWLEYSELLNLYRQMDGILLARAKNKATLSNFPSKIPELMAYAVVPVCSDVGDYTELYMKDGENALLFNSDDSESCFMAIKRMIELTDEELICMKKAARACVENEFDYLNWIDTVSEFLLV